LLSLCVVISVCASSPSRHLVPPPLLRRSLCHGFLSSFLISRPPPNSTLFPYTTLFRSHRHQRRTDFICRGFPQNNRARTRRPRIDRKSTRLNSSHVSISYAVFCLKKKTT